MKKLFIVLFSLILFSCSENSINKTQYYPEIRKPIIFKDTLICEVVKDSFSIFATKNEWYYHTQYYIIMSDTFNQGDIISLKNKDIFVIGKMGLKYGNTYPIITIKEKLSKSKYNLFN